MELLNQFNQFRQQMAGRNPQQMVNELMQSGKMDQATFDRLSQQTQGLLSMFRR